MLFGVLPVLNCMKNTNQTDDSLLPQRRDSLRLFNFDYGSSKSYFVTICTHEKRCIFGAIRQGVLAPNRLGMAVNEEFLRTADMRAQVGLDEYIVMPNHFHALVLLGEPACKSTEIEDVSEKRTETLSTIINGFKAAVTRRIRAVTNAPLLKVWQRGYYDHIVRNDDDLRRIRVYIRENPQNWGSDRHYRE